MGRRTTQPGNLPAPSVKSPRRSTRSSVTNATPEKAASSGRRHASNGVKRARKKEPESDSDDEALVDPLGKSKKPTSPSKKRKVKNEDDDFPENTKAAPVGKTKGKGSKQANGTLEEKDKSPAKKRKTKAEKDAEKKVPIAERTVGSKLFVGPHVSAAGGIHNAVSNGFKLGANAFALFLKSQRKWANPPLDPEVATSFINGCSEHSYDAHKHVVPHGSYLVNLAHTDSERVEQAYNGFIDDLERCNKTGIGLYNIHPGNFASSSKEEGISQLAAQLNKANADPRSGSVVTLLETMATAGNTIGGTFEDLRDIISQVRDKSRIGVCLDTCHIFAAGYDVRTPEAFKATFDKLDKIVGLKYLRALHVNDSKAPLNSKRDLHANLGTGFLGLRAFHSLVNESRLWGLPFILETPIDKVDSEASKQPSKPKAEKDGKAKQKPEKPKTVEDEGIWAQEVKLLESMVGMDAESEVFVRMEEELSEKGREERERVQGQVDRRNEKAGKGKGKVKDEDDD